MFLNDIHLMCYCWCPYFGSLIKLFQGKINLFSLQKKNNQQLSNKLSFTFSPKLNPWMLRAPHYWRSQFCELFRWICGLELNSFRERNGLAIFRKTELLIFLAILIGKIYGCITCYIEEALYCKVFKSI